MKLNVLALALLGLSLGQACLLPEEIDQDGFNAERGFVRRQSGNGLAIGTGDRFNGGSTVIRGLGSQASGTTLASILNVNEVKSGFDSLVKAYGVQSFTAPYKTYNGATVFGGQIGTCPQVYFNAAIHARERGSSDNLLYFLGDLLYANQTGTGLTYGSKSFTNADVKKALSVGIVFLPLSNPDGVAYDQSSNSCWRKNRNPASSGGSASRIGVDLNRNFDFLWDFPNLFASSVSSSVASTSPASETYHGTSAFSEPETKNIKWVMDENTGIHWFVDIHSYAGDVLYSWGSDTDQGTTPAMNFLNSAYDSKRGVIPDSGSAVYSEYISSTDSTNVKNAASRMTSAMTAATGRSYTSMQAAALYPTSGASDDYSYSRTFADSSLNKIHGFTLEFGFSNNAASCPFYPTSAQYQQSIRETGAGFMAFLLAAADIGNGGNTC